MMPDLGPYTDTVLGAYGVALVLLAALVVVSLLASRRVARALKAAEERCRDHG